MKRELKFRFWDGEKMGQLKTLFLDIKYRPEIKIMQYTGLKDRNGKEICEGDICLMFTDEPSEVLFENAAFGYKGHDGQLISFNQNRWFILDNNQSDVIEVVGNIYENPEIIKINR